MGIQREGGQRGKKRKKEEKEEKWIAQSWSNISF